MASDNAEQKVFWEQFATHWVGQQSDLDGLMQPVLDRVLMRAGLRVGQQVLDIGCGTGTSTMLAAQAVGASGHVTGVDISEAMLDQARKMALGHDNTQFVTADAAVHPFAPAQFDCAISRFGVMFFVDPVAAFANIRTGLKTGAKLSMACWSYLDSNPWFQVPMYAAKDRLGAPPPVDADAPGPLAFRDITKVCGILEAAGFIVSDAAAEDLLLTPPGDIDHVARHACTIGPTSRTIQHFEASEADVAAIADTVKARFADYVTDAGVRVPAQINFFDATAA